MTVTVTTRFDPLFRRYRGRLPVAYLRALSKRESNLNPNESHDPAWGLMQVVPVVRESYNRRFGTTYNKQDLLDPEINVQLASELLNRIVKQYGAHPDKNLKEDWANPEFVKLVTAGWNSGYSEKAGVGRVASHLEARGIPVTHDNVFQHAAEAGATRHLQNSTKYTWQRSVADLYFGQPDAPKIGNVGGFLVKAALTIGAGLLAAHFLR